MKSYEIDGKKFCTCCHELKDISEFSKDRVNKNGSIQLKSVCRSCCTMKQKQKRQAEAVSEPEPVIYACGDDYKKDTIRAPELTPEDIKGLKELLQNKERLLECLDHNNTIPMTIISRRDKSDRIKKTYNIDPDIIEALNQKTAATDINQSDLVNIALRLYLKLSE